MAVIVSDHSLEKCLFEKEKHCVFRVPCFICMYLNLGYQIGLRNLYF